MRRLLPRSFHEIDDASGKTLGCFLLGCCKGMADFRGETDVAGLLREVRTDRECLLMQNLSTATVQPGHFCSQHQLQFAWVIVAGFAEDRFANFDNAAFQNGVGRFSIFQAIRSSRSDFPLHGFRQQVVQISAGRFGLKHRDVNGPHIVQRLSSKRVAAASDRDNAEDKHSIENSAIHDHITADVREVSSDSHGLYHPTNHLPTLPDLDHRRETPTKVAQSLALTRRIPELPEVPGVLGDR